MIGLLDFKTNNKTLQMNRSGQSKVSNATKKLHSKT